MERYKNGKLDEVVMELIKNIEGRKLEGEKEGELIKKL